jgi:outer membrane protein, heavy metal efflux system
MKTNLIIIFTIFSLSVFSQSDFHTLLNSVEEYNQEIKAAKQLLEAEIIQTKRENIPANPVFEIGMFPGSNGATGTKKVYGISQSFDFPTIYLLRSKIAKQNATKLEFDYLVHRQAVLEKAAIAYVDFIFHLLQEKILIERQKNAVELNKLIQKQFEIGDATIIDANKAQFQLLHSKSELQQLQKNILVLEKELELLNGGKEIIINDTSYFNIPIPTIDSLISQAKTLHPITKSLEHLNKAAILNSKLAKQNWLPGFDVGYESEIDPDGSRKGFKFGIEVPLWNNAISVKQAKANELYIATEVEFQNLKIENKIFQLYHKTIENKKLMAVYKESIEKFSNLDFLKNAFDAGQISLIEYLNELTFYYNSMDNFLNIEHEYYINQMNLMSFTL